MDDVIPQPVSATSTPEPPGDPLLACLMWIAAHHGRAVGADVIRSGLPLEGKPLSASLLLRAAERAGLEGELSQRPLDAIPALVLPCIIFRESGPLVLEALDNAAGTALLREPLAGEATRALVLPKAELAGAYIGTAVLLRPVAQTPEEIPAKAASFGWFFAVIRKFGSNYRHIAAAALLINLLALAFPLFTMAVYDRVLPNYAIPSLVALASGMLLALVFDLVIRMARARMIDLTGKQADMVLASRIFERLLALRLKARPGRIGVLANQIRDFDSVREFFTSAALVAITDIAFAALFIAVMFMIGGPLGWIPVVLLPIVIGIGLIIQRPLSRAMEAFQGEASQKHGILVESMSGLETIKVVGAEASMQANWERSIAASARAGERVHHWSTLALTLSNTAQQFASLAIMVAGVFLVMNNTITVGALVATNLLSGRVLAPLTNIAAMIARANQTLVALRAIDRVMGLPTERSEGALRTARRVERGEITFENVSFVYPGTTRPALNDVSFRISAGERVGIVGRIGSGKTTVGRLLVQLYAPDSGRILLDGVDQRQFDPVELRRDIGFALQDCELFHGTLRANIVLGRPSATDAEVIEAARLAGVDAFASQAPEGYEMMIAEGGRSLSGGQRQAVSLARALLRQPRVLFLDEPTSALDVQTEAQFCKQLGAMAGNETTVLISTHRVSLLAFVDRILVFDAGKLVADGPRDIILAKLGYRQNPTPPATMPADAP